MEGLLYANIAVSFAIMAVLLLRKFFLNRFFAKFFVLLWALIIIRLLLPFEFSSALSIYHPKEETIFMPAYFVSSFAEESPVYYETAPNDFSSAPSATKNAEISEKDIVFALWTGGALFFGGFFALKHFSTVKKIKSNCVSFNELPEGFENEKIRFYKNPDLGSPLSFGLFHPVIVIPEQIDQKQLPLVLLHEKAHIKNRDAAFKTAALAALSLNWFNPFVWVMVKFFERDLELFCDERVLFAIGNEKSALYANTILDFVEKESLSLSFFSAASLQERVVSIMKNKSKRTRLPAMIMIFAAVLMLMTACGTSPRLSEQNNAKPENINSLIQNTVESKTEEVVMDIETAETSVEYEYTVPGDFDGYRVDFVWPCEETAVTTEFWGYKGHTGIDIGQNHGSEICAAANGTVIKTKWGTNGYGRYVIIDHGNSVQTVYAHLSEIYTNEGQKVEKGELIGLSGSSGNSAGTHLHFELRYGDLYLDPTFHIKTPEQKRYNSSFLDIPGFIPPCDGEISSSFGNYCNHNGIDFRSNAGSSVFASASGTVIIAEYSKTDLGNYVIIDHGNGFLTVYAHCEELFAESGQNVASGETIATVGSSGNSTGTHLHFEIIQNGENLDPEIFISK